MKMSFPLLVAIALTSCAKKNDEKGPSPEDIAAQEQLAKQYVETEKIRELRTQYEASKRDLIAKGDCMFFVRDGSNKKEFLVLDKSPELDTKMDVYLETNQALLVKLQATQVAIGAGDFADNSSLDLFIDRFMETIQEEALAVKAARS